MLNPSTADAQIDDPTIRRCLGFAWLWGYGSLEVVNLFAYRTPHPQHLRKVPDPVGPENDRYLVAAIQRADRVVVAWGNRGEGRSYACLKLIGSEKQPYCLGITQKGQPIHPLYVRKTAPLIPFQI